MHFISENVWFNASWLLVHGPAMFWVLSSLALTIDVYIRLYMVQGKGLSELEMAVLVRDLEKKKKAKLEKIRYWQPVSLAFEVCWWTCSTIWRLLRGYNIQAIEADGWGRSDESIWGAAYNGDLKQVKIHLADNPFLLDMRDGRTNMTPLDRAALQDQRHVVDYLIKHGATIDAAGLLKTTALHHASYGGSLSCAYALLKAGADPRIVNFKGDTPAHHAITCDETILLKDFIVRRGVDVNYTSCRCPLLHWAADSNKVNAVKLLLEMGAAKDLKDKDGLTAMAYAVNKGHTDVVTVLTEDASKKQRDVKMCVI